MSEVKTTHEMTRTNTKKNLALLVNTDHVVVHTELPLWSYIQDKVLELLQSRVVVLAVKTSCVVNQNHVS
jgi:hypothetical protein